MDFEEIIKLLDEYGIVFDEDGFIKGRKVILADILAFSHRVWRDKINMTNTITITESEYAKLKEDAERYRFLRCRPDVYLPYIVINGKHHPSGIRRYTDIALDNVIDQALALPSEKG